MTKGKITTSFLVLLLIGMVILFTPGCGGDSNGDIDAPSGNQNGNIGQPQEVEGGGASALYQLTGQLRWPNGEPVVYDSPRVTVTYTHGDGYSGRVVADADGKWEISNLQGITIIELRPRDGQTGYTSDPIEVSGPREDIDIIITYSHHSGHNLQGIGRVKGVKCTFMGPFGTKICYSKYNEEKEQILCEMDGLWGTEVTLIRSYTGYKDSIITTISGPSSSGATMIIPEN